MAPIMTTRDELTGYWQVGINTRSTDRSRHGCLTLARGMPTAELELPRPSLFALIPRWNPASPGFHPAPRRLPKSQLPQHLWFYARYDQRIRGNCLDLTNTPDLAVRHLFRATTRKQNRPKKVHTQQGLLTITDGIEVPGRAPLVPKLTWERAQEINHEALVPPLRMRVHWRPFAVASSQFLEPRINTNRRQLTAVAARLFYGQISFEQALPAYESGTVVPREMSYKCYNSDMDSLC